MVASVCSFLFNMSLNLWWILNTAERPIRKECAQFCNHIFKIIYSYFPPRKHIFNRVLRVTGHVNRAESFEII